MRFTFSVYGRAVPDGASAQLKEWRLRVRLAAAAAGFEAFHPEQALAMTIQVLVRRPARHFRANGELRDHVPADPIGRRSGSPDEILRAILDALMPAPLTDDALVAHVVVSKQFAELDRVDVAIWPSAG